MAMIHEYVGKTRYHKTYKVDAIHDLESALKWVSNLPDKKVFYVKNINLYNDTDTKTIVVSKLFSKENFVKEYKSAKLNQISVAANFHQYEITFVIDLSAFTVELMFPKSVMIDYGMIEGKLHLL